VPKSDCQGGCIQGLMLVKILKVASSLLLSCTTNIASIWKRCACGGIINEVPEGGCTISEDISTNSSLQQCVIQLGCVFHVPHFVSNGEAEYNRRCTNNRLKHKTSSLRRYIEVKVDLRCSNFS
jgi:hypothetical protein